MEATSNDGAVQQLVLHHQVEQFLNHEGELLDFRDFEGWLDLLADDIHYWMPLMQNKNFGEWEEEHTRDGIDLNWFDEGKFELEQRVKQIMTGLHWAEEPISRTCHLFSNLRIVEDNGQTLEARVRFIVYRNRNETETDFFVGKRHDTLRRTDDSFLISARKIYLDQSVLLSKNLSILF